MLEWLQGLLHLLTAGQLGVLPLSALLLGVVLLAPVVVLQQRRRRPEDTGTKQAEAPELEAPELEAPEAEAPAPSDRHTLYTLSAPPPDLDMAVEEPAEPARTRYANAALLDRSGALLPAATAALAPGSTVLLRLDIGPLSADSQVTAPRPFPDRPLPDMAEIEVLVSSSDVAVAAGVDGEAPAGPVARGRLVLPRDGGPAVAPDGGIHLWFRLTLPARAGTARGRIGYYFRDALLQSQRLTAEVGGSGYAIVTDFTVSEDLTGLDLIPERPRVAVLTNANGDGDHQLVIRSPGAPGPAGPGAGAVTLRVGHARVSAMVKALREAMGARAPEAMAREPGDLAEDLRRLAPIGWMLNVALTGHTSEVRDRLLDAAPDAIIQVLRPAGSVFAFPWAWIYDIPLSGGEPSLCPMIARWDGAALLFEGQPAECPHGPHAEDVLCPFGFVGFRRVIEQLASTDRPVLTVPVAAGCEMVAAETRVDVDEAALAGHVGRLRATLTGAHPGAGLREAADKATLRAELGRDLALLYFYCHGERRSVADPDVYLSVGRDEAIPAPEFIAWVDVWRRRDRLRIWDGVRPLVFVNACHSAAIYPETLASYLDAFIGRAHAAGVIGTEVKVHQDLAMAFAERFFELLLGGPQASPLPVGEAMRRIRLEYLARGNLFGLMYTPYCWADLKLSAASG